MFQNFAYCSNTSNIQEGNNMEGYNASVPTLNGTNGMEQAVNVNNIGTPIPTSNSNMWCHDILPVNSGRDRTTSFAAADKVLKDGGVLIPNRIFVGGISADTTGNDLLSVFSTFGAVRSTRIVLDQYGSCRGYGFVTFSRSNVVSHILNNGESPILKSRNWNIAPAVRRKKNQPTHQNTIITNPPPTPLPNLNMSACLPGNVNVQPIQVNAAIPEPAPVQVPQQVAVPFNYELPYENKCPNLAYYYVIS